MGADGVQARNKAIPSTRSDRLEGARSRRKITRPCDTCNKGVAAGTHGDAIHPVLVTATEVSGVDQRRAGGVQLCNEGVAVVAAAGKRTVQSRLEGARSCG